MVGIFFQFNRLVAARLVPISPGDAEKEKRHGDSRGVLL
jgi:hypothetical protein